MIASALNALKANSGSMALTFIPFTDRVNVGMGRANLLNPGDQTAVKKGGWGGCVDVRATKKKNKGETEYFMPDSAPEKGDRFTKFDNGTPAAHKSGYKLACNPQSIIGPTSNVSDVTSQLGKLTKGGTGALISALPGFGMPCRPIGRGSGRVVHLPTTVSIWRTIRPPPPTPGRSRCWRRTG